MSTTASTDITITINVDNIDITDTPTPPSPMQPDTSAISNPFDISQFISIPGNISNTVTHLTQTGDIVPLLIMILVLISLISLFVVLVSRRKSKQKA